MARSLLAISVLEIAAAVRRGRLRPARPLDEWLADPYRLPELRFEPVDAGIAQAAGSFDDSVASDWPTASSWGRLTRSEASSSQPILEPDQRLVPTIW